MDSVARILELIVDFLKRNYKKPKLWFAILGILVFIILIFPYIDSNTFYYTRMVQIPLHRITDSASNGSVFPVVTEHFSASSDHAFL